MIEHIEYARRWLGTPYIYGGNNPLEGMDCSGFVSWVLKAYGWMTFHQDLNAQGLYERFSREGAISRSVVPGCLLFFGKDIKTITHVALAIDEKRMIECGGGDHTCSYKVAAARLGAMVRELPIEHRCDLVTKVILPVL